MARTDIDLRKATRSPTNSTSVNGRSPSARTVLFRDRRNLWGDALNDWSSANRDLIWKPAVELGQKDGRFEILAALPGVETQDVDVQVTPEDVLIKANIHHDHTAQEGTVHVCEFECGTAFRSVHLAAKIDPNSVKAEYRDGMLRLTAAMAKAAAPQRVDIKAAYT